MPVHSAWTDSGPRTRADCRLNSWLCDAWSTGSATNGVSGLSVLLWSSDDCGPLGNVTVSFFGCHQDRAPPRCSKRSESPADSYHGNPVTRPVNARSLPSPTSVPELSAPDLNTPAWTVSRSSAVCE